MNNIGRISVILASILLCSGALAAIPGSYMGAGIGYSSSELDSLNNNPVAGTQHQGSAAGRVFGGYNLNQNFGVEGGYNYYGSTSEKIKTPGQTVSSTQNYEDKMQSADVVGKAYLPVSNSGVDVYALGGAAYVHGDLNYSQSPSANVNKVDPKYGVGVSYAIPNSPVTTALEVTRTQNVGASNLPSINNAMLTISYTFH